MVVSSFPRGVIACNARVHHLLALWLTRRRSSSSAAGGVGGGCFAEESSQVPSWANSESWLVDDDDSDGERGGGRGRDRPRPTRGAEIAVALSGPPGCGKTAAVIAVAQVGSARLP